MILCFKLKQIHGFACNDGYGIFKFIPFVYFIARPPGQAPKGPGKLKFSLGNYARVWFLFQSNSFWQIRFRKSFWTISNIISLGNMANKES
jgi:hypothetical protein